jgi:5-bromo-4-chloroindolyl phosphate hydrolysis protein
MRRCNRCKVIKDISYFRKDSSKTCINCSKVSKNAYDLKKNGELPKYAKVQKLLEEAYNKGNFICKICNQEKELSNFGKHTNNNKYNISRVCKSCSIELNKESKIKGYKISKSYFIDMLEKQYYKCKICNTDIKYLSSNKDKSKSACIDHDHKTNRVRGLLCSNCNRALGLLKDDFNIIQNAYNYIVQYKSDKLLENP